MKKSTHKQLVLTVGVILALTVLVFGGLHQAGYVFSGFKIVQGSTLHIENARPNSDVFIDNKRKGSTNEKGSVRFTGIRPGSRNVIVATTETWPWIFDFESASGATYTLEPLQVFQDTEGLVLLEEDPLYEQAEREFTSYREPSQIQPLARNGISVWVTGTSIFSQHNDDLKTIFVGQNPIRNIFWYGDRNDVVIIATQNNVFAIDLRQSQVQNFQPIYTGATPEAVADPIRSNKIFVRDAEHLFAVTL